MQGQVYAHLQANPAVQAVEAQHVTGGWQQDLAHAALLFLTAFFGSDALTTGGHLTAAAGVGAAVAAARVALGRLSG